MLTLGVLAAITVSLPPIAGLPLPGFVAIALFLIGCVVAMPSVVRFVLRTCATLASSSQRDRHRADRRHGALRDVECFFHHREFQFDGVDGHYGHVVPGLARSMDAKGVAGGFVCARRLCGAVVVSG